MTLPAIRAQMAAALNSIPDLRASAYITEDIAPPMAVFDFEVQPDLVFAGGAHMYVFTISVFVARSDVVAAQKLLDVLRDPTAGIKQTLQEWDWAGAIDDLRVGTMSRIETRQVGEGSYLAADIEVEVIA